MQALKDNLLNSAKSPNFNGKFEKVLSVQSWDNLLPINLKRQIPSAVISAFGLLKRSACMLPRNMFVEGFGMLVFLGAEPGKLLKNIPYRPLSQKHL